MSESQLSKLLDPKAEDHFLAKAFAQRGGEPLRKAVIEWEDQVERLSSDCLKRVDGVHDRSNVLRQVDHLKHQLVMMKQYWDQSNAEAFVNSIWCVSEMEEKEEGMSKDKLTERKVSEYLKYAEQVTLLFSDTLPATRKFAPTSLLVHAARAGHVSLTLWILKCCDRGSSFNCFIIGVICNATSNERHALLQAVLSEYQPDVHEMQYETSDGKECLTLLEVAAHDATPDIVLCVLDYIEGRDEIEKILEESDDQSACGMVRAAIYAVGRENETVFFMLLPYLTMYKPNCDLPFVGGDNTLLIAAVLGGNLNIVSILVEEFDVDPNITGMDETPMLAAVRGNDLELVKYLIDVGAWIEDNDEFDTTALMCAIEYNHSEIVMFLVEALANVSAEKKSGETPISIALQIRNEERAQFLTEVKNGRADANVALGQAGVFSFFHDTNLLPRTSVELIQDYLDKDFRV